MSTDRDLLLVTGQIVAGYLDLVRRHSIGQATLVEAGLVGEDPPGAGPHLLTARAGTRAGTRGRARSKKRAKKGAARGRGARSEKINYPDEIPLKKCIACGEGHKMLKVHLRNSHSLTVQEYIVQYGAPAAEQFKGQSMYAKAIKKAQAT